MNISRNMYLGTGLISFIALLSYLSSTDAFEYSAYCQNQCMIGRGGNLCRCNAVHFAGKRTSVSGSATNGGGSSRLLSDKADSYNAVLDKDRIAVGNLLSYLLSRGGLKGEMSASDLERSGGEPGFDPEDVDGDSARFDVDPQKRFPLGNSGPYRSWYGRMNDALRRKYAQRFTED